MTNEERDVLLDRVYEKGKQDAYNDIFKQLTPIIAQLQNLEILTKMNNSTRDCTACEKAEYCGVLVKED